MNTKELILENTLKLMIEKENSLISIRQISDATGITTGGIYHYFINKEEICNEITERYLINYFKFHIDELQKIKGNAKEKIHNVMAEIFKQKQTGIKIETIDNEIEYRTILLILTTKGFAYKNSPEFLHNNLKELKEFFKEIIKEGQKNSEIRQDIPTEDIADSLIIIYIGIQYKWDVYLIDDMTTAFEDAFNLEWEKIKFKKHDVVR